MRKQNNKLSGIFELKEFLRAPSEPIYVIWPHRGNLRRRDFVDLLNLIKNDEPSGLESDDEYSFTSRVMSAIRSLRISKSRSKNLIEHLFFHNIDGLILNGNHLAEIFKMEKKS